MNCEQKVSHQQVCPDKCCKCADLKQCRYRGSQEDNNQNVSTCEQHEDPKCTEMSNECEARQDCADDNQCHNHQ